MTVHGRDHWDQVEQRVAEIEARNSAAFKKQGAVYREYAEAAEQAKTIVERGGLLPERTEFGEARYRLRQGVEAACHGREDAAATLLLQLPILKRLEGIRRLLWILIALLAYIAYRVS